MLSGLFLRLFILAFSSFLFYHTFVVVIDGVAVLIVFLVLGVLHIILRPCHYPPRSLLFLVFIMIKISIQLFFSHQVFNSSSTVSSSGLTSSFSHLLVFTSSFSISASSPHLHPYLHRHLGSLIALVTHTAARNSHRFELSQQIRHKFKEAFLGRVRRATEFLVLGISRFRGSEALQVLASRDGGIAGIEYLSSYVGEHFIFLRSRSPSHHEAKVISSFISVTAFHLGLT